MKRSIQTFALIAVFAYFMFGHTTALLARQAGSNSNIFNKSNISSSDECPQTTLIVEAPGVDLQNPNSLLSAFAIRNAGNLAEHDVTLTSLALPGGNLTLPASLPVDLGTIQAGTSVPVDADFSGGPFIPNTTYTLSVRGTFSIDETTLCFAAEIDLLVPPNAPGSGPVKTASVHSHSVTGAPFPATTPGLDDTDNGSRWTVPTGPFTAGTPTQFETLPQDAPSGDPPAIDFVTNNSLGINGNTIAEPSGASGGGVVFVTANSYAAFSKDGGRTFTQLNPTTIFPADAIGFCCDQIVQFVPSIDRFIWILQGAGASGLRLATASPATILSSKGTSWTYWNFTPAVFGQPAGTGFDYPDVSVGTNYLYVNWDIGWPACPMGCNSGREVARILLSQIKAGRTIGIDYTKPSDSASAWGGHLSQNTRDQVFWAGQLNTSNQLRIFSLKEGSNRYFWQDIALASWARSPLSSTTPDGQDWLTKLSNFPKNAVLGLTRTSDHDVWFAWSAGTDTNFPQPHVEIVNLDVDSSNPPKLSDQHQVQIWNKNFAFAYPSMATNRCTGEVGLSLEYGGGGNFENHVVGFWGDFLVFITTASNVGTTRFGDYVTLRQHPPTKENPGNLFDAFGYGLNTVVGAGTKTDTHYIVFGRPAASCKH